MSHFIIQAISVYALILIFLGTIGNIFTFMVCIKLRKTTTFVFLAFISVSDSLILYFWNLNHFTDTFFGIDLQNYNIYSCKFGCFLQFTSMQVSAWLLVTRNIKHFVIKALI